MTKSQLLEIDCPVPHHDILCHAINATSVMKRRFLSGYYSYCERIRRVIPMVTNPPHANFQLNKTLFLSKLFHSKIALASECTNGSQHPISTKLVKVSKLY